MIFTYLQRIVWLVGLVLLQVLILNHIHIAGYATAFLYLYFILKLESGISRNELMLWAFGIGVAVDIFSDTRGMNAAASVFIAFLRPYILRLFSPRDMPESVVPSFETLGVAPFSKYLVVSVFIHTLCLVFLEFFSLSGLGPFLLRAVLCMALTVVCMVAIEVIRR